MVVGVLQRNLQVVLAQRYFFKSLTSFFMVLSFYNSIRPACQFTLSAENRCFRPGRCLIFYLILNTSKDGEVQEAIELQNLIQPSTSLNIQTEVTSLHLLSNSKLLSKQLCFFPPLLVTLSFTAIHRETDFECRLRKE